RRTLPRRAIHSRALKDRHTRAEKNSRAAERPAHRSDSMPRQRARLSVCSPSTISELESMKTLAAAREDDVASRQSDRGGVSREIFAVARDRVDEIRRRIATALCADGARFAHRIDRTQHALAITARNADEVFNDLARQLQRITSAEQLFRSAPHIG